MSRSQRSLRQEWLKPVVEQVQEFDREITKILVQAYDDINVQLKTLPKDNISGKVRAAQLIATRKGLYAIISGAFQKEGIIIEKYNARAAAIAAELSVNNSAKIFDEMGLDDNQVGMIKASLIGSAVRGIDAVIQRRLDPRPLSQRVWNSEAIATGQLERIINTSIISGASAEDIAKQVRQFANPNTPGGAPYVARRLGRTEIVNAYHAQAIQDSIDKPWVDKVRWNLSKSHPTGSGCRCELYAMKAKFKPDEAPPKPHPQCLCFITPEVKPWSEIKRDIAEDKYSSWLQANFPEGRVSSIRTGGSTNED